MFLFFFFALTVIIIIILFAGYRIPAPTGGGECSTTNGLIIYVQVYPLLTCPPLPPHTRPPSTYLTRFAIKTRAYTYTYIYKNICKHTRAALYYYTRTAILTL